MGIRGAIETFRGFLERSGNNWGCFKSSKGVPAGFNGVPKRFLGYQIKFYKKGVFRGVTLSLRRYNERYRVSWVYQGISRPF